MKLQLDPVSITACIISVLGFLIAIYKFSEGLSQKMLLRIAIIVMAIIGVGVLLLVFILIL